MHTKLLAAVSLKSYFGQEATLAWVRQVRGASTPWLKEVDLLVLPVATALAQTVELLEGSGIEVGAQDCSWTEPGAYTGELPPALLSEVGVRVVEVGHAERRRYFGEDDAVIGRKAAAAAAAGLTPLVCVGEPERVGVGAAIEICLAQIDSALVAVPALHPVVIGYEPVWAIGADQPAKPGHIRSVCRAIREHLGTRDAMSRVIYGGTAGPGLFQSVQPDVDGLFLGRRAQDVNALAKVLQEMAESTRQDTPRRVIGPEV